MASEPLNWCYTTLLLPYLIESKCVLDMGTGGGEYLSLLAPFHGRMFATEGYEPNVSIARNTLEPLGVTVKEIQSDDNLPFMNNQFDLIMNKHESFEPKEIDRILIPGGVFVTQQVGGKDLGGLNSRLGAETGNEFAHWSLKFAREQLTSNGFIILKEEEQFYKTRFYDIGAIIYYLKAIPWQIPGFQSEKYAEPLAEINKEIEHKGYCDFHSHRFLLIASK
ncbi:class I SAM-dependent methyltransferase [Bacillus sp. IB182487]|uniref:Class I SAM-dependent methyltransferase n=2 Tax=Metabacillus arenae TaxID=2771434 RepID=A0A926RWJ6_9BACI|nr:class I SAM-dependent methyltransferase [Metabacillus arenae]